MTSYFQFGDYSNKSRRKNDKLASLRSRPLKEDENLTGFVKGIPAGSDDEERFARSFYKYDKSFDYQVDVETATTMPSQNNKVDFVIDSIQPFEPRGYISHYFSIEQEADDRVREVLLNEVFARSGLMPLKTAKYTEYEGGQQRVNEYTRRNL